MVYIVKGSKHPSLDIYNRLIITIFMVIVFDLCQYVLLYLDNIPCEYILTLVNSVYTS